MPVWILGVQLKRLKLRKNNWDCETYQFDEVLTETASQKRVYEVVAKPVVEVFILFLFTLCSTSHSIYLEFLHFVTYRELDIYL
jgi:hypothetical protein